MDLTHPRVVLLIDASAYLTAARQGEKLSAAQGRTQRRAQSLVAGVESFFQGIEGGISAYMGDGEVAVLKACAVQDLAPWSRPEDPVEISSQSWGGLEALKRVSASLQERLSRETNTGLSIGVGRYHPGVHGLAHSYNDARAALLLGRRFNSTQKVHCLGDLGIAALVGITDEQVKTELAAHLLSPLNADPELLTTIEVFFEEDCAPSAAAQRLAIHRNTLRYRLDKIASLTGLDPRHFDDAVQIRLALLLRSAVGSGLDDTEQ
jgi:carbohydrate diacid regulator